MASFFSSPVVVFSLASLLRLVLLVYGQWQDANSPVKYTDIDYYVFTDAASSVYHGQSPYDRETYRYTPLLAWLLVPTAWSSTWFSFGKVVFAIGDIVAGLLIVLVLHNSATMSMERSLKFASIWLLNPMVATISTRGSSEGLLGVMVIALLWATASRRILLAGVILGFSIHFKIYPFVYAPSIVWWLDDERLGYRKSPKKWLDRVKGFINRDRIYLAFSSLATFFVLNSAMYILYGSPFIQQTYLHHVTRIDHRHNFSPYNIALYLSSALEQESFTRLESVAFVPQLCLSFIALPLCLAKKDLAATMMAQTFAFVTFNKVCTSQYFLWYMVFLPFYLPSSSLLARPYLGLSALGLWIIGQAAWLQQGFQLEFLGESTFMPGLWSASLLFFVVNCALLGIIAFDISGRKDPVQTPPLQVDAKITES